jgi:hypothetical protein
MDPHPVHRQLFTQPAKDKILLMQLCIGGLNLPDNPYLCLGILQKYQKTSLGDYAILHHALKKHQSQLIINGYNCANALSMHHCIILRY